MLDFARADAEREAGERAVGAGVGVAAHDRHPRQRGTLLRPDDVDDTLSPVAKREIRLGAVFLDVGVERFHLDPGNWIVNAAIPVLRRRVVIGRGNDRIDAPRLASRLFQAFVGLRARHFVDEMTIDVQQRRAVAFGADDMAVPEFVVERARNHDSFDAYRSVNR